MIADIFDPAEWDEWNEIERAELERQAYDRLISEYL